MKTHCYAATVLLLSVTGAMGQSLDQTFDQLGSKLEAVQQSLTRPTPGTTVHVWGETPLFSKPDASAVTPLKLDPNAPVVFQGVENGFVKIAPQNSPGTIFYVPPSAFGAGKGALFTGLGDSVSGTVSNQVKNAMETLKGIARDLQQNPYVRMKGFSVNVSFTPSLNIDFEMKEPASATPPATPTAPTSPNR
jgi:hypothetical protein